METKDFKFKIEKMDDEQGMFTGYASIFGEVDSYGDVVEKGAFQRTIKAIKTFPMLWYHNPMDPIGVINPEEDDKGLKIQGHLNLNVSRAREIRSLMQQQAVRGLSIGFEAIKKEWDDENNVRHLKEIKLWEISPVTFQACPGALVDTVKSYLPDEAKPYPNEHSARLKSPDKFDEFKRKKDGEIFQEVKVPSTIGVIWGHLKDEDDDNWAEQSLRFPTKDWTAAQAKKWLKDNNIKYTKFEPAQKSIEAILEPVIELETISGLYGDHRDLAQRAIDILISHLEMNDPESSTHKSQVPKKDSTLALGHLLDESIAGYKKIINGGK